MCSDFVAKSIRSLALTNDDAIVVSPLVSADNDDARVVSPLTYWRRCNVTAAVAAAAAAAKF